MTMDWTARAAAHPEAFIWINGRPVPIISGGGNGGGKTSTTVTTQIPPKTEEELSLIRKQNEFLDIQLQEVKRQNELLAEAFPAQKALFEAQTRAATVFADATTAQIGQQTKLFDTLMTELTPTEGEREIQKLSEERTLAILRGEAPPLSPEQKERIDTIFGESKREGEEDIKRFAEELAASRGMRLSDSPIGGEALRARTDFQKSLSAGKAAAELNVGQAQQAFEQSVAQFQAGLRQQAQANRLALLGRGDSMAAAGGAGRGPVFTTGAGLQGYAAITPALEIMSQERIAGASRSERGRSSYSPGFLDYFKVIGPIVAQGVGAGVGAAVASSKRFKKDITPLDRDEYEAALKKVTDTPIARWRYKHEGEDRVPHIGPILEMSPEEMRASDTHLSLGDWAGLLHAGVKAVAKRTERTERKVEIVAEALAKLAEVA